MPKLRAEKGSGSPPDRFPAKDFVDWRGSAMNSEHDRCSLTGLPSGGMALAREWTALFMPEATVSRPPVR